MPSINMIAPKRAEQKRLERIARKILIIILAEVILTVSASGVVLTRAYRTKVTIKDYDVRLSKLQPTVKKIETYEKAIKTLKPKVELLTKAETETLRWCRIMDCLSSSVPDKTWLTRIHTSLSTNSKSAGDIEVNINGISQSQNLVGETMLRMHDQVKDFDKVDLHFTQNSATRTSSAVEFEIGADIKSPKSKDKQEVKSN